MSDSEGEDLAASAALDRKIASRYVDDIADATDDDDEEEDYYDERQYKKAKYEDEDELLDEDDRDATMHQQIDQDRFKSQMTHAERLIEEKYGREGEELDRLEELGEEAHYGEEIETQQLPPSVSDPKLWLVKCNPGKEMAMVLKLMQKYNSFKHTNEPLFIYSAFCVPATKGYIYVEADKKAHVTKAIEYCHDLKGYSIQIIPLNEMVTLITLYP